MMELTPKERLLRTLRREPVDRVPISTYELLPFGADPWYETQPSYSDLLKFIADNTDNLSLWDQPAKNRCAWDEATERWSEGQTHYERYTIHAPKRDLSRVTRRDDNVNTTWTVEPLFKSLDDAEAYYALPWENGGVDMSRFHQGLERMGERGIMLCDTLDPVCALAYGLGMERFLILAWEERTRIKKLMDVVLERLLIEIREKLDQGAGPLWRIYGPEYVSPPYFPPRVFKELVVAYDKPIVDLIHEYGGYARVHSHGRVNKLLDLFVEMGADATDPLEPPPQGDVDLAEVKKRYGDRLILFGNIEFSFMEHWSPDEIETLVKRSIDAAAEGGGYVIMPSAAPINAPLWEKTAKNYYRFIETALEYGRYT